MQFAQKARAQVGQIHLALEGCLNGRFSSADLVLTSLPPMISGAFSLIIHLDFCQNYGPGGWCRSRVLAKPSPKAGFWHAIPTASPGRTGAMFFQEPSPTGPAREGPPGADGHPTGTSAPGIVKGQEASLSRSPPVLLRILVLLVWSAVV